VYSLNVKVPYFLVAEWSLLIAKRGNGAIIDLSTMVSDYGAPGMALYGSSKSAIKLLTKAWAAEYGPSGVRVNAVSPDLRAPKAPAPWGRARSNSRPKPRRAGRPQQTRLLRQLLFLATDRASFIHGAILPVDEGRSAI